VISPNFSYARHLQGVKGLALRFGRLHNVLYGRFELLTARAFAESPSVRIKVHLSESFPPASFASSSFVSPEILDFLLPSVFLSSLLNLKSAQERTLLTTPIFSTATVSEH